ncbi:MAG: S1 RNA-binding domain-containing protein [Kiritimatiellae bacterium]|nr:S1 RNA-binding domain-containing protein [Kiritimatiellia bacterium]
MRMKIVCSDAAPDRADMWPKVMEEFKVGDKLTRTVGKVSDIYGVFFELLPGFDALAHISNIRGLGGRRPSSLFETGQELPVQIIELDERRQRVQLTVDASGLEEVAIPGRSVRDPAYRAIELWSMNNPEKAQAAEDWLRTQTKDAPMHGSRLGEVVKLFGVPRPVSAWLKWLGGYESLPPMNKFIPSHPLVVQHSRMDDQAYWDAFTPKTVKPADGGTSDGPSREDERTTLLVDGSNVVLATNPGGGGQALFRVLRALKLSGYFTHVFFDANIEYKLKEANDEMALRMLEALRRAHPERITVVPSGTRADDYLLLLADKKGLGVVSNDAFRDQLEKYPWLANRIESGEKRLHPVSFADGQLLMPTLNICMSVADLDVDF